MLGDEFGCTVLALRRHRDDPDHRCVVLRWDGTSWASSAIPNDEARSGHPLWARGLADILWGGMVEGSELVARLERSHRVHERHDASRFAALTHYIVLTKERTVEVAAETFTIERREGSTLEAAIAAYNR